MLSLFSRDSLRPLTSWHWAAHCPLCSGPSRPKQFCEGCRHDMQFSLNHHPFRCVHCALPLKDADSPCPDCRLQKCVLKRIEIAFDFVDPLKALVWRFKNAQQPWLAAYFAHLLKERFECIGYTLPAHACLVPIPSSPQSLKKRGYNPATELAKQLSALLNVPYSSSILYLNHQHRDQQKNLSGQERRHNMADRFYAASYQPYRTAILVDDVMTTGVTLNSAARALLAAGVKQVHGIVLGRASLIPIES